MAEMLKRQYDILVLKAELLDPVSDSTDPGPSTVFRRPPGNRLRLTLQCKVDGVLEDVREWETHTSELGLGDRLDGKAALGVGPPLKLPSAVVDELGDVLRDKTDGDRELWVHLVKPYGLLRFVPWERLLGDALSVPILMLPDFVFPPPRETRGALEVVLCGSAPLGHEQASVANAVLLAVDRILGAGARRTKIHVFVDSDIADHLRSNWGPGRLEVALHDNALAPPSNELSPSSSVPSGGKIRSPWLSWMRQALQGRSVDVLHFVCHGYLARDRGAMLFAPSPNERTDRFLTGPVGANELQAFLTRVGAWSTVFTSLPDNYSEIGLRGLADEMAQARPGPLMMHSMREDTEALDLAAGYRFLYSSDPQEPPSCRSLFLYCQPYRVARAVEKAARTTVPLTTVFRNEVQVRVAAQSADRSPLDPLFEKEENVSFMVASTERFAEQVKLRFQQLARDEVLPKERQERDLGITEATIGKLREAVASAVDDDEAMPGLARGVEV